MSIITAQINLINGPILQAFVGVSQQLHSALQKAGIPIPNYQLGNFLIDTGASGTCIDPDIIKPLNIIPKDYTDVQTPSTNGKPVQCPVYDVNLYFSNGILASSSGPLQSPYIRSISVIGAELKHQGIHGLIGRDVLEHCLLVYNGQLNTYTISW